MTEPVDHDKLIVTTTNHLSNILSLKIVNRATIRSYSKMWENRRHIKQKSVCILSMLKIFLTRYLQY